MGLLWSMRSVPGSCKGLRLRKTNVCTPQLVHISVYDGHVEEGFTERPPLASVLSERWFIGPGVRRVEVQEKGVRGTLFIPPGPGPFPGVMDMWGVRGGLVEYRSALLASHGYASRALQYFAAGELSSASKEFEYFETAFNVIRLHPLVSPDRVGMFCSSLVVAFVSVASTFVHAGLPTAAHGLLLEMQTFNVSHVYYLRGRHVQVLLSQNSHLSRMRLASVLPYLTTCLKICAGRTLNVHLTSEGRAQHPDSTSTVSPLHFYSMERFLFGANNPINN